jgi:hypothetical protein
MTPLEKAKSNKGRVNYCDECEQFEIVGNAAYCKIDGKLIHPIMLVRGQGTGAAWNCKKRRPLTNYDRIISKSPEELAEFIQKNRGGCRALTTESYVCDFYTDDLNTDCKSCWLDWLMQEAKEGE